MQLKRPYRTAASTLLFFAVLGFIIFSYTHYNLHLKLISNGFLDLSGTNLHDTIYALDGEWEFWPEIYLEPGTENRPLDGMADPATGRVFSKKTLHVPGALYQLNDEEGHEVHYGSYVLRLKLPQPGTYSLKTSFISGAFNLYCNGDFVGSVGSLGIPESSEGNVSGERSVWQPNVFFLTSDTCEMTILFHVSNENCHQGGIVESLYFGTVQNIYFFQTMQTAKSSILIGIMLGIGVYLLLLTCMNNHRKAGRALSIFCIGTMLLESILDAHVFFNFFRETPILLPMKVQFMSYALLTASVFYFFKYLDPDRKPTIFSRIIEVTNIVYIILITVVHSYKAVSYLGLLCNVLMAVNIFLQIIWLIGMIRAKKKYAYLSLTSIVVLFTLTLLQVYFYESGNSFSLYTRDNLFIIGILFFILCQINILLRDVDRAYANAKQADSMEIAYLQAQISPHFMFNTLNNVSYLMTSDVPKAQKLLLEFCSFLRTKYRFDFRKQISYTLGEELDFLESYIYIENIRHHDMLSLVVNVDESVRDMMIMPMLLQPLVENSIKHGFTSKPMTIEITAEEKDDHYTFTVKDNGRGINPMKLRDLEHQLQELGSGQPVKSNGSDPRRSGVGIVNINYRLLKYCGERLHFESCPDTGTIISFNYAKKDVQ